MEFVDQCNGEEKKERSLTLDGGFGMTALNDGNSNGDGKRKRAEVREG